MDRGRIKTLEICTKSILEGKLKGQRDRHEGRGTSKKMRGICCMQGKGNAKMNYLWS
jgi:hypothetical protein